MSLHLAGQRLDKSPKASLLLPNVSTLWISFLEATELGQSQ
jgi:hypothetical protein